MQQLLDHIKPTVLSAAVAAGTTTVNGSVAVDMQGYDGVVIIAELGDVTTACTPTLNAMQATSSDTSTLAAVSGGSASITATSTNCDEKFIAVDIYRPSKRYLGGQLTRAGANAVVKSMIAIQYSGGKIPTGLVGDLVARAVAAPSS